MNVGFIGLGIMGRPMALNLRKAGHTVFVYGRRPESMLPLIAAGCHSCGFASEAAAQADVTFIMVSDTPDVDQVIFGKCGVAEGAKAEAVVIDMSTIAPAATREFAQRLKQQGVDMLDAPVSGGEQGAINGTLSIMVGGDPGVFERVLPLFEALGKNIVWIGAHGAGQVAKACNQIVVGLTIEGVAEALTFAQRQGVDAGKVRDALMGGFANSRILEVHGKRMLDDNFQPGFKVKLHKKDMAIVERAAREVDLPLPGASLVERHLSELFEAGLGELDSAAIVKVVAGRLEN